MLWAFTLGSLRTWPDEGSNLASGSSPHALPSRFRLRNRGHEPPDNPRVQPHRSESGLDFPSAFCMYPPIPVFTTFSLDSSKGNRYHRLKKIVPELAAAASSYLSYSLSSSSKAGGLRGGLMLRAGE
jgi:hypothetical protein